MTICSVSDCGRPVLSRGLCQGHYKRWRDGRPIDGPLRRRIPGSRCTIDGCERKHTARGMCQLHLSREAYGTPLDQPVRTHLPTEVSLAERLAVYAPPGKPDECWEWTRARNKDYGMISVGGGKLRGAHIVAWELANNQPLPDGQQVRHTCDNPPCVNPAHLLVGTHADNTADRIERGRHARIEPGYRHRTATEITQIRSLASDGVSLAEIARRFNCSHASITRIARGDAFPTGQRRSGAAKVNGDDVREIRRLSDEGWTQMDIADRFGITQTAVSCIVRRKTWKYV